MQNPRITVGHDARVLAGDWPSTGSESDITPRRGYATGRRSTSTGLGEPERHWRARTTSTQHDICYEAGEAISVKLHRALWVNRGGGSSRFRVRLSGCMPRSGALHQPLVRR